MTDSYLDTLEYLEVVGKFNDSSLVFCEPEHAILFGVLIEEVDNILTQSYLKSFGSTDLDQLTFTEICGVGVNVLRISSYTEVENPTQMNDFLTFDQMIGCLTIFQLEELCENLKNCVEYILKKPTTHIGDDSEESSKIAH